MGSIIDIEDVERLQMAIRDQLAHRELLPLYPRPIIDLLTDPKSRVFQPVENLIGVDAIAPSNLRNRNARNPRLRADHTLLVIAPLPPLRQPKKSNSVHLNLVDTSSRYPRSLEHPDRTVTKETLTRHLRSPCLFGSGVQSVKSTKCRWRFFAEWAKPFSIDCVNLAGAVQSRQGGIRDQLKIHITSLYCQGERLK